MVAIRFTPIRSINEAGSPLLIEKHTLSSLVNVKRKARWILGLCVSQLSDTVTEYPRLSAQNGGKLDFGPRTWWFQFKASCLLLLAL